MYKIKTLIAIFIVLVLFAGPALVLAASVPITIEAFTVSPTSISYGTSSTVNYNFTFSTPDISATKNYCSTFANFADGSINWAIIENNSAQTVISGTFKPNELLNLRVLKTGSFSFGPGKVGDLFSNYQQTTANFQLVISCYGTYTFGKITNSAVQPVEITGQTVGAASITFGSDKTGQNVAPNTTIPIKFEIGITSKTKDLINYCGNNSDANSSLTTEIFEVNLSAPDVLTNRIFATNTSFGSFGNGQAVQSSIPVSVNIPGNDVGFVAKLSCASNSKIVTKSQQLNVFAGGSGTNGGSNGGTGVDNQVYNNTVIPAGNSNSYNFNITNPLAGGPQNPFDVINLITQWIIYLSVPLAVLWIMYAGFLMLTAGPKPENFKKGQDILKFTVIGLAIIFIGKGFVSLVISVIELGGSSAQTPPTSQTVNQTSGGLPSIGNNGNCINGRCDNRNQSCSTSSDCLPTKDLGGKCSSNNDCNSGLNCNNSICQTQGGNAAGGYCVKDNNCAGNLQCIVSDQAPQIDGQFLGVCGTVLNVQYQKTLTLSQLSLSGGVVGQPYSVNLQVSGDSDPNAVFNWQITGGSLPPGTVKADTSSSSDFAITGVPTKAGEYNVTLQAMDIPNKLYGTIQLNLVIK